jgi:ABC-type lipoprotein release transport system permease subunit
MGTIPTLFGAALALGAIAALMLTMVAFVRRRRHDLALLKTLGFTRRQLAAVIAWQSTIAAAVGVVVGIPIGIVTGRLLWFLFAHAIDAVPRATVPAATVALIAVGALILANLVAAIPALQAANTKAAPLLQAE